MQVRAQPCLQILMESSLPWGIQQVVPRDSSAWLQWRCVACNPAAQLHAWNLDMHLSGSRHQKALRRLNISGSAEWPVSWVRSDGTPAEPAQPWGGSPAAGEGSAGESAPPVGPPPPPPMPASATFSAHGAPPPPPPPFRSAVVGRVTPSGLWSPADSFAYESGKGSSGSTPSPSPAFVAGERAASASAATPSPSPAFVTSASAASASAATAPWSQPPVGALPLLPPALRQALQQEWPELWMWWQHRQDAPPFSNSRSELRRLVRHLHEDKIGDAALLFRLRARSLCHLCVELLGVLDTARAQG